MKIIGTYLKGLLIVILCACGTQKVLNTKSISVQNLKTKAEAIFGNWAALDNWANLYNPSSQSYISMKTYVPERGIRGKYAMMKSDLSKNILQEIIGEKIFLLGPHTEGINLNSQATFGHYNPVFLLKLNEHLNVLYQDDSFVAAAQSIYDEEFRNYFRLYYLSYAQATTNKKVISRYEEMVRNTPEAGAKDYRSDASYFLQEAFRGFAERMENEGYDVYEGFVCPGFWVRRSIDGTSDEFYTLLVSAMKTFDPDFL